MHWGWLLECGGSNSTNAGGLTLLDAESAAPMRRLSLPPSRCRAMAVVRWTPSRRATSTGANHSSSGIASRPVRLSPPFLKASVYLLDGPSLGFVTRHYHSTLPPSRRQNEVSTYAPGNSCRFAASSPLLFIATRR